MSWINNNATHFLVRQQEIALKGKNRGDFERRLLSNIKRQTNGLSGKILSNRFVVALPGNPQSNESREVVTRLGRIGGLTGIAACSVLSNAKAEAIRDAALNWITDDLEQAPQHQRPSTTFAIRVRRIDKTFGMSTAELEHFIASAVLQKFPHLKVKLNRSDLPIHIEVRGDHVVIFSIENEGMRGLPMDSSQRVACLLSGGIDSPVAAFEVMRRGCMPLFIHFHSKPFTSAASVDKVTRLAQRLREFSPYPLELWLVPLLEIQTAIRDVANERYRTIHYRRYMMKIAEEIANRRGAKALVTGDAIGQVASQTLTNLGAVDAAVKMLVFRPLIALDKQEIVDKAKSIGTYETSVEPHDDTCVLFAPTHPSTQAKLTALEEQELLLPNYNLIFDAIDRAEKIVL